jgi:hypothetical protein
MRRKEAHERAVKFIDKRGPDDCWLWTGALTGYPSKPQYRYGHMFSHFEGKAPKYDYAHRIIWRRYRGDIPAGMHVCHRCDVPRCCNPAHMFLGTPLENMRDRDAKGRMRKTKLNLEKAKEIHKRIRAGEKLASIAKDFGVSTACIGTIKAGKTWRDAA